MSGGDSGDGPTIPATSMSREIAEIVAARADGQISEPIAIARILSVVAHTSKEPPARALALARVEVQAVLTEHRFRASDGYYGHSPAGAPAESTGAAERLGSLARALLPANPGLLPALELLRLVDERTSAIAHPSPDFFARLFDELVMKHKELSVAVYSLGDAAILARATEEIVEALAAWSLLGPTRSVLDIGCGTGRLEQALAPRVADMLGVDVSPAMIEVARRTCAGASNVRFAVASGTDLSCVPAARCDLVCIIDAMPYLVASGAGAVDACFSEIARVLVPNGDVIIFNFSYGQSVDRDVSCLRGHASRYGLDVIVDGQAFFRLWDARVFRLRARGRPE